MTMRSRSLRLLSLVALLASTAATGSLICRLPGVDGLEENGVRAKHFVGETTIDPHKMKLYIEYTERGTYYHSNFLSRGAENPTKIVTKKNTPLDTIVQNLIFTSKEDAAGSTLDMKSLMERGVEVQLDRTAFDENGYLKVDVGDAGRITLVDGKAEQSLPTTKLVPLTMLKPPPYALAGRVAGCCVHGVPPGEALRFARDLAALPFSRDRLKILSLVRDSATERALDGAARSAARVGPDVSSIRSADQILQHVREQSGNQLAILGHVEGTSFVIRGPDGSLQVVLPVATLVREADRAGTSLMLLGCRTARQINDGAKGFGVVESFNSVTAARALARAAESSSNHREFLEALSSSQFNLVIDRKYVASQRRILAAAVYSKASGRSIRRRVGDLILLLPRSWRGAEAA